ncbi:insulin-like growth factor-binding protein complex acid labile subunit [Chironomus tepperi]|uniref:insulin-like growth factor-binding protein complex acid labile subunit n=1 Tax=Chironomus tepperi TaxID=113505 RepID=UPI00391F4CD4
MQRILTFVLLHVLLVNTFESENCPGDCHCTMDGSLMLVDCSSLELSELPDFEDNQVHILDLSKNQFTMIPPQLEKFEYLQYLDLSENQIQKLKPNSLKGLVTLGMLNLSKNNISSWAGINPNTLLAPAVSLRELSLSGNPLTSFSSNDENLLIVSKSLQLLDLSYCKISKIMGQQVLRGMSELNHLILAGNQIRSISDIESDSLMTLDLSNNRLTNLMPTMLTGLPALTSLNLARNYRLSLENKNGEFVHSVSLRRIDLSFCNMDKIEIDGFPALTTAILKGNMLRQLTTDSFVNNQMIENLDLSQNSINSVDSNTFKLMKRLKTLNLSYNMIPRIEREAFKENELLTKLDISRNYLSRFNRITAPSLTHLNMTWCEIMTIEHDALSGFQELISLDLSNNLISELPDFLASSSLQVLDLSMNRMVTVRNFTFAGFPELQTLKLAGNRFTTPFRRELFSENPYLAEISLSDNPWQCNCNDLYGFYTFITDPPAKVWEKQSLKCQSPENVAGRTWEKACFFTWYPQSTMGRTEKIWTFFMVSVIAFSCCMCLIMSVRRAIEGRAQTLREQERERNLEEGREIIRQNRVRMQQEAQRDAPDPRETRPPCYSDAIRMPRLDASFASLNDYGRAKNKARRKDEDEEIDEDVPLRRNRCRSEEILSMRSTVNDNNGRAPLRVHPFEGEMRDSRPVTTQSGHGSYEEIRNFNEQSVTTLNDRSPYAARRQTGGAQQTRSNNAQSSRSNNSQQSTSQSPGPSNQPLELTENHFESPKHDDTTIEEREGSNEFITFEIRRQTDYIVPPTNADTDESGSRPTSF